MAQVRVPGSGTTVQLPREVITARGDDRGESLKSLNTHSKTHTDWRDTVREGLSIIGLAPKVKDIKWSDREIDANGRVAVNASDAFYGVSQPELQRGYELWRRNEVNNSPAGQEHFGLYGRKPLSTSLGDKSYGKKVMTNEGDLVTSNATEQTRRTDTKKGIEALTALEVTPEGAALKAELLTRLQTNPQVTVAQINDAIAKITKYNPETITTRATATAGLENTRQSTASMQAADALALRTELNNTAIQMAEIDFKNKTNEYNWKTANADRDYQWRSDEADRDLKATLTQLGYEDKRDERALSREDRRAENRQLMILQLMKGLGNLGGAMAF